MKYVKAFFGHKRVKSFLWRTGMMALAGFLAIGAEVIGDIGLSGGWVVLLGLMLGEVSKAIANFAKEGAGA